VVATVPVRIAGSATVGGAVHRRDVDAILNDAEEKPDERAELL